MRIRLFPSARQRGDGTFSRSRRCSGCFSSSSVSFWGISAAVPSERFIAIFRPWPGRCSSLELSPLSRQSMIGRCFSPPERGYDTRRDRRRKTEVLSNLIRTADVVWRVDSVEQGDPPDVRAHRRIARRKCRTAGNILLHFFERIGDIHWLCRDGPSSYNFIARF